MVLSVVAANVDDVEVVVDVKLHVFDDEHVEITCNFTN